MILLNQNIEAFVAVVENSTVSAAAIKLGLTQTAVTQRIKSLEQSLEVSLFTRSKFGMRLTPEGLHLHRYCLDAKSSEGPLLAGLKKNGRTHQADLSIVSPTSLISGRIIPQCQSLYKKMA